MLIFVTLVLSSLICLTTRAFADIIDTSDGGSADNQPAAAEKLKACYVIEADGENNGYDSETKTQTYQLYLDLYECKLYTGTFGMSYDPSINLKFELDTDNFAYFQVFDTEGSDIAFQWMYVKDVEEPAKGDLGKIHLLSNTPQVRTERIHMGTITVENVIMNTAEPPYPVGWHTKTLKQLNWMTTNISKDPMYSQDGDNRIPEDPDDRCLNREIWRAIIQPEEPTDPENPTDPGNTGENTDDSTGQSEDENGNEAGGTEPPTEPTPPDAELDEFDLAVQVEGYYQGYDMIVESNLNWIDIGFLWNSGYNLPEKTGRTIIGRVNSFNPNNPVNLTLYNKGTKDVVSTAVQAGYQTVLKDGRTICTYGVDVETAGEYTLEIKKDVHLTYYIDVTVNETDADVTVKEVTLYCGDISGDERIKLNDRSILLKYQNSQLHNGAEETNTEALRADLNGDGRVSVHDLNILKTYYNRSYEEAVSNG